MRKRDPNDKNYSVANPFGLQYASQAPVVQWIAPRTGIELIDPLQTDEQVSMITSPGLKRNLLEISGNRTHQMLFSTTHTRLLKKNNF